MSAVEPLPTMSAADAVLNALPHPVIVVSSDGKVVDANVAAESFFEVSAPLLRRHLLRDLVPFGSPLLPLIEQVAKTVIVDRLVPPMAMTFECNAGKEPIVLNYGSERLCIIHRHAFGQLCSKVSFPMTYANSLNEDSAVAGKQSSLQRPFPFRQARAAFIHRTQGFLPASRV